MQNLRAAVDDAAAALMSAVLGVATEPVVIIWPSEIASILTGVPGTRQSRDMTLAKVWQRSHYPSFAAASDARPVVTDPYPHIKTEADLDMARRVLTPRELSRVYAALGRRMEVDTASNLGTILGRPVTHRNSGFTWRSGEPGNALPKSSPPRLPGPITDPGPFTIVGEVDAWTTDPDTGAPVVVEFKGRMGAGDLYPSIPECEWLQLQTYLNAYGVDRGLHVQRKFNRAECVIVSVDRDEAAWTTRIMPAVTAFVCEVRALMRGAPEDMPARLRVLATVSPAVPAARIPTPPPLPAPPGSPVAIDHATVPPPPPSPSPLALPPPLPLPVPQPGKKRRRTSTFARIARELPTFILRSGKCLGGGPGY
jgi:hypothetical protein